jgi:hypothetical protein
MSGRTHPQLEAMSTPWRGDIEELVDMASLDTVQPGDMDTEGLEGMEDTERSEDTDTEGLEDTDTDRQVDIAEQDMGADTGLVPPCRKDWQLLEQVAWDRLNWEQLD